MATFALGAWIVQILGGAYLWSFTTGVNRPESNARATRLPRSLLFVHPLLGVVGLFVWIAFLASDEPVLAWVAFAGLLVGGGIGSFLAFRTFQDRPRGPVGSPDVRRAEHQMPVPAIGLHGFLAVVTVLAVLVAALQA